MHEEYVSYFAIFSVDKRDIYNNTKDYYFKLMKEIEGSVISENKVTHTSIYITLYK